MPAELIGKTVEIKGVDVGGVSCRGSGFFMAWTG